jgi:hypothetical protein
MTRITCPVCGHQQVLEPPIVICKNCYADLREFVEKDRGVDGVDATGKVSEKPQMDFPGKIRAMSQNRIRKEDRSLSALSIIVKETFATLFKRFRTLYPLTFLSIASFMLIGPLVSMMSIPIFFPELYETDLFNTLMNSIGVTTCLVISLYAQAALMCAVTNKEAGIGEVLSTALPRLLSYAVLILFMVIAIGVGTMLFLVPGVIAAILFVFAPFIFAAENADPMASLRRSIQYVRKAWLRVVLVLAPLPLVIIFMWFFFAYGGTAILASSQNQFVFIFIISMLMGLPLTLIAVYVCKIYEDIGKSEGLTLVPQAATEILTTVPRIPEVLSTAARISTFTELMGAAWDMYTKRFMALSMLNLISYLPHVIHFAIMISGILALTWFFDAFHMEGQFGLLVLMILPWQIIALLIIAVVLFFLLYVASAIFGLVQYLLLELAYVYVIADGATGVWEAIKKARTRLRGFFRVSLYWNFVVSTGWVLIIPGAVFFTWYSFTPIIFALQKDEQTPLSALWKSRELVQGLWGTVFKNLLGFRYLPVGLVVILALFIFAGLPIYWILGMITRVFAGLHLPGQLAIYSPHFWFPIWIALFMSVGVIYVPLQKVFLYVLYREIEDYKATQERGL